MNPTRQSFSWGTVMFGGRDVAAQQTGLRSVIAPLDTIASQLPWLSDKLMYAEVVYEEDVILTAGTLEKFVRPVRWGRQSYAHWLKFDLVFECHRSTQLTQQEINDDLLAVICTMLADFSEVHAHPPQLFRAQAQAITRPPVSCIAAISPVTRPKKKAKGK